MSAAGKSDKNVSAARARILGGVLLAFAVVAASSVCTQMVAEAHQYHASLGTPLFGTLYQPFAWFGWMVKFYNLAPTTYNYAFAIFIVSIGAAMLAYVLYVGFATRSTRKNEGLHGSAKFATLDDARAAKLLPAPGEAGQGVYCGGIDDPQSGGVHYLRHNGPEHVAAFAPTRSGKGVVLVNPTLLSWLASAFILDRKGELHVTTAGWRRQAGQIVLRFDPAEAADSCAWNALEEIRFRSRYQVSDTQNIAVMLIDTDGLGIASNHFRSAAYDLFVGLILHALYKSEAAGRKPGLGDIAQMLTGIGAFAAPDTANNSSTNTDTDSDGDPRALAGLWEEMRNVKLGDTAEAQDARLVIAGIGRRMAETPARELGSIISTANNALSLYRDPIVAQNTSHSDFVLADLMDHERPVSLYFIVTPRNDARLRPLIRLMITLMVQSLADQMDYDETGRARAVHRHRLLLMLDEFPTLGRLEVFESALAYIAGYGMKAYLIMQDVQQLYKAYTNFESIVSNCHIRVAFAPNKLETAEWLSRMTGQTTVVKEQVTTSGKRFGAVLEQVSRSYQEVQRPLMTPDEVLRLRGPEKDAADNIVEPGEMLVFAAGVPVIKGRQTLYFRDLVFMERAKIAPPKETDRIRKNDRAPKKDGAAPVEMKAFVVRDADNVSAAHDVSETGKQEVAE